MLRLSLNGQWVMRKSTNKVPDKEGQNTAECISKGVQGRIPGSVYSFLLGAGLMEDPYYRDRELDALRLMEEDYIFTILCQRCALTACCSDGLTTCISPGNSM